MPDHNHGGLDLACVYYYVILIVIAASLSTSASQQAADAAAQRALSLAERPSGDWDEYCEAQRFSPTCGPEHVIVVTGAWYGRQRLGKCVKVDYGYVGCYADVLNHLDGACSGRRSCTVAIPDASLDLSNTCPKEFKTYLNASHICVEVEKAACQSCAWSKTARLTARRGYISSTVTSEENECGTIRCPWSIEVKTGQKINITLYDFAENKASTESVFSKHACSRYGVIREKTAAQDTPICSGHGRESRIYTSLSNSIEIQLVSPEVFTRLGHFLLHYEVLGCPDYVKPDNMWMNREDNRIQLGCLSSNDQWQLVCKDLAWDGQIGTCPQDHKTDDPNKVTGQQPTTVSLGIGLLTAIVLGIALVVGVLILTVGVVCLKRQQHNQRWRAAPQQYYYPPAGGHQFYYDYPEPMSPELLEMHRRHKAQVHAAAAAAQAAAGMAEASGQRIYLPVAGGPPVTLHNSQRQNIYLRHMDSRPLPSIPSLTEESTSDDDVIRTQAIVHRANSSTRGGASGVETPYNRSLCSNPLSTSSQGSRTGDPQYFILDGQQGVGISGTADDGCGASASATTSPSRRDGQGQGQGQGKGSCSEIQLRPSRDGGGGGGGSGNSESNNGNSSWP